MIRFIALCLSLTFTANVVLAEAGQSNLWETRGGPRRANVQLAALPSQSILSLPRPGAAFRTARPALQSPVPTMPKGAPAPLRAILQALSPAHGVIQKVTVPDQAGSRVIVHIQDVHLNDEAQRRIGRMIASLSSAKAVQLIALEGAFGPINFDWYRSYPSQDAVKAVADYFFREKRIAGPAHAALTSLSELPLVVGVDDPDHYQANVAAYRRSVPDAEVWKIKLKDASNRLAQEKIKAFNRDLLSYDASVQDHKGGRTSWRDHVRLLTAEVPDLSPNLLSYLAALEFEDRLDFGRVERERSELIAALVKRLDASESDALLAKASAFRAGALSGADFYAQLKDLCGNKSIRLNRFPTMDDYIRYVLLAAALDVEAVLQETALIEKRKYELLARTDREWALVADGHRLALAAKLLDFSLTSHEWREYKTASSTIETAGFSIKIPSAFEAFYEEAQARDQAMAENLRKQMERTSSEAAILVSGGFHSAGLVKRLSSAGITVVTVSPRITTEETGSAYLSLFTQDKTALDRLFQGEKLFLSSLVLPDGAQAATEAAVMATERLFEDRQSRSDGPHFKPAKAAEVTGDQAVIMDGSGGTVTVTGNPSRKTIRRIGVTARRSQERRADESTLAHRVTGRADRVPESRKELLNRLIASGAILRDAKGRLSFTAEVSGASGPQRFTVAEGGNFSIDISVDPRPDKGDALAHLLSVEGYSPDSGSYTGNQNTSPQDRDAVVKTKLPDVRVNAVDEEQDKVTANIERIGAGIEATEKYLDELWDVYQRTGQKPSFLAFDVDDTLLGLKADRSKESLLGDRRSLASRLADFLLAGTHIIIMSDNDSGAVQQRIGDPLVQLIRESQGKVPPIKLSFYTSGMATSFSVAVDGNDSRYVFNEEYGRRNRLSADTVNALAAALGGVQEKADGSVEGSGILGDFYLNQLTSEDPATQRRQLSPAVKATYPGYAVKTTAAGNSQPVEIQFRDRFDDGSAAQVSLLPLPSRGVKGHTLAADDVDARDDVVLSLYDALHVTGHATGWRGRLAFLLWPLVRIEESFHLRAAFRLGLEVESYSFSPLNPHVTVWSTDVERSIEFLEAHFRGSRRLMVSFTTVAVLIALSPWAMSAQDGMFWILEGLGGIFAGLAGVFAWSAYGRTKEDREEIQRLRDQELLPIAQAMLAALKDPRSEARLLGVLGPLDRARITDRLSKAGGYQALGQMMAERAGDAGVDLRRAPPEQLIALVWKIEAELAGRDLAGVGSGVAVLPLNPDESAVWERDATDMLKSGHDQLVLVGENFDTQNLTDRLNAAFPGRVIAVPAAASAVAGDPDLDVIVPALVAQNIRAGTLVFKNGFLLSEKTSVHYEAMGYDFRVIPLSNYLNRFLGTATSLRQAERLLVEAKKLIHA